MRKYLSTHRVMIPGYVSVRIVLPKDLHAVAMREKVGSWDEYVAHLVEQDLLAKEHAEYKAYSARPRTKETVYVETEPVAVPADKTVVPFELPESHTEKKTVEIEKFEAALGQLGSESVIPIGDLELAELISKV